jgi:opacity protein-like surface antigen
MKLRGAILSSIAALALSSASAVAADLNNGPMKGSIKDGYHPVSHARPANFYLRGDFGWGHNDLGSIHELPNYDLTQTSIGKNHLFGLGVGYYFSRNVRGDFTLDWRSAQHVRGSVLDGAATVQGERSFDVKNLVGLFNIYYDFDIRSHFTPYIGVGLGFARNRTTAGSIGVLTTAADPCDPGYAGGPIATCAADFDGASKWNAAGALMAGFSARLHDRLHLDAGYRFLYVGDARTGDVRITHTATGATPLPTGLPTGASGLTVNDLSAHEWRVGLRWDIR